MLALYFAVVASLAARMLWQVCKVVVLWWRLRRYLWTNCFCCHCLDFSGLYPRVMKGRLTHEFGNVSAEILRAQTRFVCPVLTLGCSVREA